MTADGDNIQWMLNGFASDPLWCVACNCTITDAAQVRQPPARHSNMMTNTSLLIAFQVPIGWTLSPALYDLGSIEVG